MKNIFGLLFLILAPYIAFAQAPAIEWAKCYGGTRDERASSIIQTRDGGYIIAGRATSNDFDVSGNHYTQKNDFWIVKINALGIMEWQKMLGGSEEDIAYCIIQDYDGGYVVSGVTSSEDGDVTGYHGSFSNPLSNYWVVKLDSVGTIQWETALGGIGDDQDASVVQTTDSNYVVAGYGNSFYGDATVKHYVSGAIPTVKLDRSGVVLWEKNIRPLIDSTIYISGVQGPACLTATSDGGFALGGIIDTFKTHTKPNYGYSDGIIIKLNDTGGVEWYKLIGGNEDDRFQSMIQTTDGGYALAGWTNSNSESMINRGDWDYWVVKLKNDGSLEWQKSLGGSNRDIALSIAQTKDRGFAVAGETSSSDGDVTGFRGGSDYWLVKLNTFGAIEWQKSLGGSNYDIGTSVIQSKDGGIVVAGSTLSLDGDVKGIHPLFSADAADYWIVKLMPELGVSQSPKTSDENIFLSPNPSNGIGKISYTLASSSVVKIEIYNPLGEKLRSLINNKEEAGSHEHSFDISGLPSGSYFLRIQKGGNWVVKTLEVVK